MWLTYGLFPAMIAARGEMRMDAFDAMHRTYTSAFTAQMLLLLGVAALTAWMHLHRSLPLRRPTTDDGRPTLAPEDAGVDRRESSPLPVQETAAR